MRAPLRLAVGLTAVAAFSFSVGGVGIKAAAGSGLPYNVPTGPVAPNPTNNNLDCNGWATGSQTIKLNMRELCTDPIAQTGWVQNGYQVTHPSPFYDNGHYVGHDEPTAKFISTATGSGYQMTWFQQLSSDPSCAPTTNPTASEGTTCSDYAELSPAPWFGLAICDPESFPAAVTVTGGVQQAPCAAPGNMDFTGNSESSSGQAFMEMQFYPPGYGPWIDSASPDMTKWTAALNIDSLEAISASTPFTSGFETNPKCTEPVNFAFITLDGKPLGPPSPQQADLETFTTTASGQPTNPDVLYMNPGDVLKVVISDVPSPSEPSKSPDASNDPGGLRITIDDLTTGQTGFMTASAANGFMDTSPLNCTGSNWSFHGLYDTAAQSNQVSWAALEGGVLMEDEIGHGEVCSGTGSTGLANQDPAAVNYAPQSTDTFADSSVYDVCNDATNDPSAGQTTTDSGEGQGCAQATCPANSGTTEDNAGTNTYGGRACTSSDSHCESADGFCLPQGVRSVTFNGSTAETTGTFPWSDPVAYCDAGRYQNGDLDYDGTPYQTLWPDGSSVSSPYLPNNHPTTFRYIGPFDPNGNPYGLTQFETDSAGSENDCDTTSGANCTVPAYGAQFYPFWSLSNVPIPGITVDNSKYCVWNFGNDGNPGELDDFGGDGTVPANGSFNSQYATPGSHYKGTLITGPFANPQVNGRSKSQIRGQTGPGYSCPSFTLTQVTTSGPGNGIPESPWMPGVLMGGALAVGVTAVARRRRRQRAGA